MDSVSTLFYISLDESKKFSASDSVVLFGFSNVRRVCYSHFYRYSSVRSPYNAVSINFYL